MKHPFMSSVYRVFTAFLLFNIIAFSQWIPQVSGSTFNLYSVHFVNNFTGLICSSSQLYPNTYYGGEILRTSNGGLNWVKVLDDSTFRGKSFFFFNESTGFAIGGYYGQLGRIYKTTNSGLNWINLAGDSVKTYLYNVYFLNNSTGFAGAIDGVLKTTNGGINWSRVLNVTVTNLYWGKVHFFDLNTGIYSFSGKTYKTINSGLNWSVTDVTPIEAIFDIKFVNANTGYICGDSGTVFRTTSQGASWSRLNTGTSDMLYSIFFVDASTGYITSEHTIIKTTDSGLSWASVFKEPADTLFSSYFLDANTGYTCGDSGRVFKTTTGGVIGINIISSEIPKEYLLGQNYPNPFNPNTKIKFAIPYAAFVKITVYDMIGRELESLS